MLKNAVVVVALALVPSVASAEIVAKKAPTSSTRTSRAAAVEATSVAMNAALTVDSMVDKIHGSYMTGLRRCYEKGLAQDPALKGKVTLTFSISAYGNVSGEAAGTSDAVNACIAKQIKRWKFGRPMDKREASYRINLVLAQ